MHLFDAACHIPPAFSQSAFVVYFDISPDGLAAGDELPDPEVLGVDAPLPEVLPELLPPVLDGVLELPDVLPPLFVPLLDCAAAIAGARATTATRRMRTSFCIMASSDSRVRTADAGRRSNVQAASQKAEQQGNWPGRWRGRPHPRLEIRGISFPYLCQAMASMRAG